jgi:hypothetical protein
LRAPGSPKRAALRYPGIPGNAAGTLEQTGLVAETILVGAPITSSSTVHFQSWFRGNSGSPCGGTSNLSDAMAISFGP